MSTSHDDKGAGAAPVKWPASRHRQVQRVTSTKPLPRVEKGLSVGAALGSRNPRQGGEITRLSLKHALSESFEVASDGH
jgi:hypothetical protein